MEYGYIINGQLMREKQQTKHNKPLTYTDEPSHGENQATAYSWEDKGEYIEQVWTVMDVEPVDDYSPDEPTADEATPDAWDVEQGEYIPAGRIITVHGVMYECIKDHYAAWSKQPPNSEYWKEV